MGTCKKIMAQPHNEGYDLVELGVEHARQTAER